jgi:DNA repair protein RadC
MMNYHAAVVQLPLVRESSGDRVATPADAYRVCGDIAALAQEAFHVLVLDAKNKLRNRYLVSLGLVDASLVHPREVFRCAIESGGSALVLVHNHPSGDPTPSQEDVRITRQLVEAGKIIDIKVLDHVVIGRPQEAHGDQPPRPGYVSLRESGLVAFA